MHSRRFVLRGLASAPVTPFAAGKIHTADATLIVLGAEFSNLAAKIDHAIEDGTDIAWEVLHQLDGVEAEIVATPATTIDGLCVKARAACWALLGDFDSVDQSTTDRRMMASIARDLMGLSQRT